MVLEDALPEALPVTLQPPCTRKQSCGSLHSAANLSQLQLHCSTPASKAHSGSHEDLGLSSASFFAILLEQCEVLAATISEIYKGHFA